MAVRVNPDGSITVGIIEDKEEVKVEAEKKPSASTKKPTKKTTK